MLRKTIVAGAALLAATLGAVATTTAPAEAKAHVHFGIYVGVPGPFCDPWDCFWAPGVIYVPGYYYHRPYYRPIYRWRRVRHHRPRWRKVCVSRKVRVRYWNGHRWRWRTVRKKTRCRWVRYR